jgi:hypothetical protein
MRGVSSVEGGSWGEDTPPCRRAWMWGSNRYLDSTTCLRKRIFIFALALLLPLQFARVSCLRVPLAPLLLTNQHSGVTPAHRRHSYTCIYSQPRGARLLVSMCSKELKDHRDGRSDAGEEAMALIAEAKQRVKEGAPRKLQVPI